ncbi:permease prefix domain 1-containing protein [Agromyces cerinus]|uniref:DUF4153 domain-containing protein n=1 Tax=Agromyces cerinus subsp. cerinus TaxID=232089 RepID=A0A1N6E067_9MICO|nr:permease prefix domain 1-containing protein [Agromyces cerinus]SIN76347.1 hypothetical protein SAMN05443544_0933 [Agromyces cerinus subsp. cerinus]
MTTEDAPHLDELIASWRDWIERRDALSIRDVDELESHLRDRVDALSAAGLTDDEAFLIAVKRLGSMDELSREYAAEHSGRLWKQLVLHDSSDSEGTDASDGTMPFVRRANGLTIALLLGVGAGIAVKATELLTGDPELVFRNIAVLVLPFLAAWFAWRRRPPIGTLLGVAATFALVALALNLYPFDGGSSTVTVATQNSATAVLATIGSIVALWLVTGIVDAGGAWRSDRTRMDFLRFSGEWLVYYVLIAIVGGALSGLTVAVFASIQVDIAPFIVEWVLPCGAAGAVLVSAWLVGAKQRVIENIAPVLTKVFTPLFTLMMLALIVASVMQWNLVGGSRELLIAFDLVLVVVVALLVYAISARDPALAPGWFDRLQVLMLVAALVVDVIVLVAMIARTGEFGFSANKTASLGLNLILLANLAWATWLQIGFVRRRVPFGRVESWQTAYLPVYLAWAAILVFAFPPMFDFA